MAKRPSRDQNKTDLANKLSERTNLPKESARKVIDIVFQAMKQELIKGGHIEIRGMFSITLKRYEPYIAQDPRNLRRFLTTAKIRPRFKCSKELLRRLNVDPKYKSALGRYPKKGG